MSNAILRIRQWPPRTEKGISFTLRDKPFTWGPDEPFLTRDAGGAVRVDDKAQGFVNRVMQWGAAQGFPQDEWSEQTILDAIYAQVATPEKWFVRAGDSPELPVRDPRDIHPAPLPAILRTAILKLWPEAAEAPDAGEWAHYRLGPVQWLKALSRAKAEGGQRLAAKAESGPLWWWAIHAAGFTATDSDMSPAQFVSYWLGSYTCPDCRRHFRRYLLNNPTPESWRQMPDWSGDAHEWVTAEAEMQKIAAEERAAKLLARAAEAKAENTERRTSRIDPKYLV